MNFPQINIPQHEKRSSLPVNTMSPHNRMNSVSTDASGLQDLIETVLEDIEEHEKQQQKQQQRQQQIASPPLTGFDAADILTESTSIDDETIDTTPSLPMSTTNPAIDTQIAFITHHKNQPPQVTVHKTDQQCQYKLFSPNPFYPGQSLPILVQIHPATQLNIPPNMQMSRMQHAQSQPALYSNIPNKPSLQDRHSLHSLNSTTMPFVPPCKVPTSPLSLQPIDEDPILKMEKILKEKEDNNDGKLDMEEFNEALHEIDKEVNNNDAEHIFNLICGDKENEISIDKFIEYMHNAQNKLKYAMSTPTISATSKTVFRAAFPDIFGDVNDVENRELWGNSQMTSIHKLEEQLQEEAENEGVIDYPEFEAAINNMGIAFTKHQLKRLFAHFLGEQDIYNNKMNITRKKNNKYEVNLGLLMDLLKDKVENHRHLKPEQILQLAFMELLLNENTLNKRSSFLHKNKTPKNMDIMIENMDKNADEDKVEEHEINDGDNGNDTDDSFEENPDFDAEYEDHDKPPTLSPHGGGGGNGSYTKGDRHLMRMGSSMHWNDNEVEKQRQEMEDQLKMMQLQTSSHSQPDLSLIGGNQYINTPQTQQKRTFNYYK